MLATFQRAMQRRECTIAGVRLGPVTLAQAYCLAAWESPFLAGGRIELADFGIALWTCSRPCWPFDAFVDEVNAGKPDKLLNRVGRRYDLQQFPKDRDALADWIEWHCHIPPRFSKGAKEERGSSAPWPMIVAIQLIPLLGEERVWTLPLQLALAYKIAKDNAGGDMSWKSEAEEAMGYANAGHP